VDRDTPNAESSAISHRVLLPLEFSSANLTGAAVLTADFELNATQLALSPPGPPAENLSLGAQSNMGSQLGGEPCRLTRARKDDQVLAHDETMALLEAVAAPGRAWEGE